jgi:hypothetical protein
MLPTKFRFIWLSSFKGEDFLEIDQSETRIACGGHVCWYRTIGQTLRPEPCVCTVRSHMHVSHIFMMLKN